MRMVISMEGVRVMTAGQKIERIRELIKQCEEEIDGYISDKNRKMTREDLSDIIVFYYGRIEAVVEMGD